MLGLQIDEPTFPLDVSSLDPVSFVSPSLSAHDTQSAYCNQKGVAFNGWHGLGSNQYAAPSTEYTGFSLFDTTVNGDLNSICKLPSSRTQNEGWCLDCVSEVEEKRGHSDSLCRSKPEKGVMDAGFQGPSMKQEDGGGSKEYMGECGEAFLASLMRTMGHDVHFVGDVQASKMRRENALLRFLPSNNEEYAMDVSSCDEFRMYEFKVRRCMKGRSHDWTECPFAHPGEKARRRDPRRFHYSGTACPDFRRGNCKRGDACELSHGVFECWLHPARYRTQLCKDGKSCKRRVCFFAHSPSQLRLVSPEHVPRSGSSFKSPFSSFSDSSYKHPQYALSPSKLALSDTYGAEGFLDDFSPRSMHSFPDDRILDAFRTITGDCHILDSTHRHSNNGVFESSDPKKCYGSNGWSVDGKGDKSNLESIHAGNSHNYLPPLDDGNFACQYSYVHSDSYIHDPPMVGMPVDGFSNHLAFKNNQAHVNLRTQLALASLSSKFEQIMSPTSTLVRHVFSPPALSPPLSPSDSPPMSPSMVFPSCNATSRKMAALYGHTSSRDALSTATDVNNSRANGNSPSNTSLLANLAQSNGAAMFANTCGPSPLSTFSVGDHTNHGDMITAVQPMSTQHVDKDAGLEPGIEEEAHVFPAYQRLRNKRPALPLNGIPVPESRWEADQVSYCVAPMQRVESGQGLRAKIYGKLGKEEVADAENPDFGWVNDLVT